MEFLQTIQVDQTGETNFENTEDIFFFNFQNLNFKLTFTIQ